MMNKHAKKELSILLGLGALVALKLKSHKTSIGLGLMAGALASLPSPAKKSYQGKTVGITGGSRGLGLALAKNFLLDGASVHLIARDSAELEKAREILQQFGPAENIHLVPCDITIRAELTNAVTKIYRTSACIDLWINDAGAILVGPFDSMTMEDFDAQMRLHLYANIQATQELLPIFRRQKQGQIVNICSLGGRVAIPHMLPYDTSKFALAGFSQGITAELAQDNISVTTVFPATLRTGSPLQALFKGDMQKEFAWFANADVMPGLSMDADEAAKAILEAAREQRTELILPALGRLRLLAEVLLPELMAVSMSALNQILPQKNSLEMKTGAELKTKDSYLFSALKDTQDQAEKKWNQSPKTNAAENLSLK